MEATRIKHQADNARELADLKTRQPTLLSLDGMVTVHVPPNAAPALLAAFRVSDVRNYIQRTRRHPGAWIARAVWWAADVHPQRC